MVVLASSATGDVLPPMITFKRQRLIQTHLSLNLVNKIKKLAAIQAIIPGGGYTPVLQPLDGSINKPLMNLILTVWTNYMTGDGKKMRYSKFSELPCLQN